MKVAIGGASGLLGSRLVTALEERGDQPVKLVRRPAQHPDERSWDPTARTIEQPGLTDVDAVVNLAGASIAGWRWTKKYKALILSSRVDTTQTIAQTLAEQGPDGQCRIFLSASAMGIYGYNLGDREITETSPTGTGFLADVCRAWEGAAEPAAGVGVRVTYLRTANVLAPTGGIVPLLRVPFRLGLGGRIGSGLQWFSWVTAADHVRAMLWLLDNEVAGPVNMAAPEPVRNRVFTREFAQMLRRPAVIPFPRFLAGLVLTRQVVDETVGAGQRVVPRVLEESTFEFKYPRLADALAWLNAAE